MERLSSRATDIYVGGAETLRAGSGLSACTLVVGRLLVNKFNQDELPDLCVYAQNHVNIGAFFQRLACAPQ